MMFGRVILLCSLISLSAAVWKCDKPTEGTTTTTTTTPKPPEKGYNCDGGKKVTIILGIFLNKGAEAAERSLPEAQYGVEVLNPHTEVNYEELRKANDLWGSNSKGVLWAFESKAAAPETKKVEAGSGNWTTFYQRTSTCKYFNEFTSTVVEEAIKVHSEPAALSSKLEWGPCEDSMSREQDDGIDYSGGDRKIRFDGNSGNKPLPVQAKYYEGFVDTSAPDGDIEPYSYEGRKDDTQKLMDQLNQALSQIPSPSPVTGLANIWSNFKVTSLGLKQVNFSFDVPPGKSARSYQAFATCGPMKVSGPAFPVFLPLNSGWHYAGACESPNLDACVANYAEKQYGQNRFLGTPEKALKLDMNFGRSCKDSFHEATVPTEPTATEVQIQVGLSGPWADKVNDGFKKLFSDKLRELKWQKDSWEGSDTGFTWKTYDILDWTARGTANMTKTLQLPATRKAGADRRFFVLQVVGSCGLYSYYTDGVVFVDYAGEKDKWHCITVHDSGLQLECDGLRQHIAGAVGVFQWSRIACKC